MKSRSLRSFTLIELVVVLIIIATIAGLVLPNVGSIGRSSDMAASASSQRELASNLQLYFALQKRFPEGLDSLLVGDGSTTPTAIYTASSDNTATGTPTTNANLQVAGLPVSTGGGASPNTQMTVATLTNTSGVNEEGRSFARCGFEYVYDHAYTALNSNDSTAASVQRLVTNTTTVASVTPATTLFNRLLPNGLPAGATRLVALGIGGRNAMIGKTNSSAPIYPGCDGLYYGRFIAYFILYRSGERATLAGVSDSYGRTLDYTVQQFNESLPNGGRQG